MRADAGARIRTLVGQTEFTGKGGAQINPDGAYEVMVDAGALKMSSLEEIKARLHNTGEATNSIRTDILRVFHDFIGKFR